MYLWHSESGTMEESSTAVAQNVPLSWWWSPTVGRGQRAQFEDSEFAVTKLLPKMCLLYSAKLSPQ
jgi:hypothetical protein